MKHIVTEIAPHALMAETFGVALKFWHGAPLTVWFVSEGPYSRTDMAGLRTYFDDVLVQLGRAGYPVDPALFAELIKEEQLLGREEAFNRDSDSVEIAPGVTISIPMSLGSRRSGFEGLRDILTRYRRSWAERNLDAYLRGQVGYGTSKRQLDCMHRPSLSEGNPLHRSSSPRSLLPRPTTGLVGT